MDAENRFFCEGCRLTQDVKIRYPPFVLCEMCYKTHQNYHYSFKMLLLNQAIEFQFFRYQLGRTTDDDVSWVLCKTMDGAADETELN